MHQNSFLKLYSLKTIIPSSESKGPGDFKNGQYFENQSKNLFLPNSTGKVFFFKSLFFKLKKHIHTVHEGRKDHN